ncbi:GA module, partial [Gardnerella vaginalis]
DFKVNEDGSVEVTYEDDSKLTIPSTDLVFQGPKISDWAPYVVPDVIEVENLTKLSDTEVSNIVSAFDTANTGITPYDEAKTKNSNKAPVTVDSKTGDATIKWADGSTTTIAAWQFLKQKPKTPTPNPQPPTPTPAAEKEFIVEAPTTQTRVKFDPFNMKETDLTTYSQALDANKNALKKVKGKDAKDNSDVTITDVSYSVKDGKGYITFKADKYKDATYPMSVFFKKDPGTQTPQTPSTETKTETDNDNPKNTFTYKVTKTETEGDTPTAQEAVKALKQFVKDNYDNVSDSDLQN